MNEKIYCSEWTNYELKDRDVCYCTCHFHSDNRPMNENSPCGFCNHVHKYGYFPWQEHKGGWVEYWRSDRVNTYVAR